MPITVVVQTNVVDPMVFRLSSGKRDVVLIGPTTTAKQFSDAVFGLLLQNAADPQGATRRDQEGQQIRAGSHPVFSWAEEILAQAKVAKERDVPPFGRHPALRFWVERLHWRGGKAG